MLRECKRLILRLCGSKRGIIFNIAAMAVLMCGLPWFIGLQFQRAAVLIPMASLSVFLVADAVLYSFSDGVTREDFLTKIGACVLVGWLCGMAVICGGLVAMNVMFWIGEPQAPPAIVLLDAAVFSLSASVLVAGAALTFCRKVSSPTMARLSMKLLMIAVVLGLLYGCNKAQAEGLLLPTNSRITQLSWIASLFFLANGAALIVLASNDPRFHRRKTQAGSA